MKEEWKHIPSTDGLYEASNCGRIRRAETCRILTPGYTNGYLQVRLAVVKGTSRLAYVHRLVCEAFHGPALTSGMQAAHRNRQRDDNSLSNLRWATQADNEADKMLHGVANKGARHGNAKLTDEDVKQIRESLNDWPRHPSGRRANGSIGKLAATFGVSPSCIHAIAECSAWRHI